MIRELLDFIQKMTFSDWFQTVGAFVAFTLGLLRLIEFRKKRVNLQIQLTKDKFISHQTHGYDTFNVTEIKIKAELINKGLKPTTINGVEFFSEYEDLSNLEMSTTKHHNKCGITLTFEPIRLEANDRKTMNLIIFKNILLPGEIIKLDSKLKFKTPHKDITQKIILERDSNGEQN